jgi:type IV pilus assembly protein PilC
MPYFKWVGVDIAGDIKKGRLTAYSQEELSERLFQRGIALLRCTSVYVPLFLCQPTAHLKAQLFLSIARLLKAGILMPDVFIIAAQQIENPILFDTIFECATDIKNGMPFVMAIKKQKELYDPIVITMLTIGHESGNFVSAVEHVAHYYQMEYTFKKNIRASLAMPCFTFVFFIGISLFIFIFLMPRFADLFLSMNNELPQLTRMMIQISTFITSWSMLYLASFVVVCVIIIRRYCKTSGASLWNTLCMKMPLIARVLWYHECGQFLHSLSLLVSSNIPLLQALEITQTSVYNSTMKQCITVLYDHVQSGILLSQAMAGMLLFSSDVVALVKVGEESGTLATSLHSAADLYKESACLLLSRIIFFIQPIVIIILGFLIGMLIFAIYLPIMNFSFSI